MKRRVLAYLRTLWRALMGLGPRCSKCGAPGWSICETCIHERTHRSAE